MKLKLSTLSELLLILESADDSKDMLPAEALGGWAWELTLPRSAAGEAMFL
jgi:hypothetical protein